jgi:putative transposase
LRFNLNTVPEELGKDVKHRTSQYKNDVLEQDHRAVKGRYRPMRGFKEFGAAQRFCRAFDEVRNVLRPASYLNQTMSAVLPPCATWFLLPDTAFGR